MQGDEFNLSGDFRGAIVNIKATLSNVSQTVGQLPQADDAAKEELRGLIDQLSEALQQVPEEKAQDAETVAKTAEQLVEAANQEKPNTSFLDVMGNALKQAAKGLEEVVPSVVTIATQITTLIVKLGEL